MCGIAGIFHHRHDGPIAKATLTAMTDVLEHRGPDQSGFHLDGPVGLGHRRLNIIDLEGGQQPIFNEDGTRAVIFNGEIYNFRALRPQLEERGHRFSTNSDTEVILHAYEEYGERCVDHLRGMFAFAVWDGPARTLFLARDRLGIKPLYWADIGGRFLFGSELKAILEHPEVDRELDLTAVDDFLTFHYIPAPKSIFKSVFKLLPGHTLTVSAAGVQDREYWDVSFAEPELRDEREHAEALLDMIREAVQIRLVADVPLGAFLSGGIDSSCVVALMSQLMSDPVKTASIGFTDAAFDELDHARAVSRKFGTDAYEKVVDPDAVKILDTLAWHYDEPFADSSMVPTYYVSQVARERVTVCLSGDGGDENFGGYRRYRYDVLENRLRGLLPAALRRPLFGCLGALYPKADWLPQVFRAKTLLTNLSLSPEEGYFNSMSCFLEHQKAALYSDGFRKELRDYRAIDVFRRWFDRTRGLHPLSRIQYVDIKTYLVDQILTKVDRASMAHALEVRVPILDHKVVELAARVPAELKLRGAEGKYIFKRALEGLVPDEILSRRKMGFSMPLARWFRADLREVFEETVIRGDGLSRQLFRGERLEAMWRDHLRGLKDYSTHLWAILMLESWARTFLTTHGRNDEDSRLHVALSQ